MTPRRATRSQPQLDFHDVIVEIMKWYVPAMDAPETADGYALPHLMDAMPSFSGAVEGIARGLLEALRGRCSGCDASNPGGNRAARIRGVW